MYLWTRVATCPQLAISDLLGLSDLIVVRKGQFALELALAAEMQLV